MWTLRAGVGLVLPPVLPGLGTVDSPSEDPALVLASISVLGTPDRAFNHM